MTDEQDSLIDEQLDERVDALVDEINKVSAGIEAVISDDPHDPDVDELIESGAALTDDGEAAEPAQNSEGDDEAPEAAADPVPEAEDEAEPDEPEPAAEPDDKQEESDAEAPLDDQVEALLSEAAQGDALTGEEAEQVIAENDDATVVAEPEPESQPEPETKPEPEAEAEADADAEPEAEPAASVEDLDAELADLAEELLQGDFDDVDAVLEAGNPAQPMPTDEDAEAAEASGEEIPEPEAAEEAPESDEAQPAAVDDGSSVPESEAGDDDAVPAAAAATDAGASDAGDAGEEDAATPSEAPVPAADADDAAAAVAAQPAAVAAAPAEPKIPLKQRIAGVFYDTAVRTSKPLDSKPTYARDIVGWFAAVTLFNAVAVWAFWFFGREPDPVPTSTDAVSIEVPADAAAEPGLDTASGSFTGPE